MDDVTQLGVEWRALAEAFPGRVGVQRGRTFVSVSDGFASTVGIGSDDLVGERWDVLFEQAEADRLERDAIPTARTEGRWSGTVELRDGDTQIAVTLSGADGGPLVWLVSSVDSSSGSPVDQRAPRRRRTSAPPDEEPDVSDRLERYETIIETIRDGVYALDEDLRFSFVNDALCEMLGVDRDDLLGTDVRRFLDDGEQVTMAKRIRRQAIESDDDTGTVRATLPTPDGGRTLEAHYRLHPEPDGEYRGSVGVIRDVTEREERKRELERRRDELETLDRINELLLETVRELVQTSSREAVERTVCDRLVASDLYQFAWIGERDLDGDRIVPRATAGEDRGYLESVTTTVDADEPDLGPVGRAMRTGEVQVAPVDDPGIEPRREAASERGMGSVAAVPLHRGDVVYGVLAVYAARPDAFSEREQTGFGVLGRTVGLVIHAARNRKLLFANSVVELAFRVPPDDVTFLRAAVELDCELALDGYVPAGDRWILYLTAPGAVTETVVDRMRTFPEVERARVISETGGRLELTLTDSSLLHTVTAAGATVTTAAADAGGGRLSIEVPVEADVREIVERVLETFPGSELVARHERDREIETVGRLEGVFDDLTERQIEALEAAYRAEYFEWPRGSTAEEIADALGIAAPTLHAHLRKAERTLLTALFDR